jgi:hypothetical protein
VSARFTAELWEWDGQAAWHFVTLPGDLSDDLRVQHGGGRGFGAVPVRVTVGASTWETSVFPDTTRGAYLLPVKKEVRRREGLEAGEPVEVALEVR